MYIPFFTLKKGHMIRGTQTPIYPQKNIFVFPNPNIMEN